MTNKPSLLNRTIDRRSILLGTAAGIGALTVGGAALLHSRPAFAAPQVGQPAPAFSATDTNGVAHDLADLKGKIVVLEWTNHDCPFVRKHYNSANIPNLQKEVTDAGAVWLSVISSAPGEQGHVDAARANELTASRNAAPTGVIIDQGGTIGRAYTAQVTPHLYVIDAEGVLRYQGGIDSIASTKVEDIGKAQPYFRDAFRAVSAGNAVQQAVTRPYGCVIKYSGA